VISFKTKKEFVEIMFENRKIRIVLILLVCICFANCWNLHGNKYETSAIQSVVLIRTLQSQYASKHNGKYAPNFDELIKTVHLDKKFSGERPIVNGYMFEMKVIEPTENQPALFSIKANPPISEGIKSTGTRFFYFDSTIGTIKYSEDGEANAQSPAI
jgi:hypothetical protein